MNLCPNCSNSADCFGNEPHTECDNFQLYDDDLEILELYHGISDSMKTAIKEIMKVTQERGAVENDGAKEEKRQTDQV